MQDLFFPFFCLGCRREGALLCADCKATLEISEYNYCLCSKHPLRLNVSQGTCARCAGKKLSGLYAALPYQEKALTRKLIHQFKYPPHVSALAQVLARLIIDHLMLAKNDSPELWSNSVLVAIPLEKSKLKKRGYNQSELLAAEISRAIAVPTATGALAKIKKTRPQMELSAKEREENINGAFSVLNPELIRGKKVFLVDDVYTTGATMRACAETLKHAGAKQVWGIAIAREG